MAATFDFEDGNGPVPAHRHVNPDGSEGGWVAETARVEPTAFVGPDARVFDYARVFEDARVSGNARVFENAEICGNAALGGGEFSSGVVDSAPEAGGPKM